VINKVTYALIPRKVTHKKLLSSHHGKISHVKTI